MTTDLETKLNRVAKRKAGRETRIDENEYAALVSMSGWQNGWMMWRGVQIAARPGRMHRL